MSRWPYVLIAAAAVAGAAGVIEAAIAAHRVADPRLVTSAQFLMRDGAAGIAIVAVARGAPRAASWFLAAAAILLFGTFLFCSDLSMRVFAAQALFPYAAPIGGTLMILAWLTTAATGIACCLRKPTTD